MLPKKHALPIFLSVMLLAGACGVKPRDNPLDPKGGEYEPPRLVILSAPANNDTLTTDSIHIEWSEFFSENSEFQFRLDNEPFSGWGGVTEFSRLLDEGKHTLTIQTRYPDGKETDTQILTFYVFALSTPAVYVYPRRVETSGNTAVVSLRTRALPSVDVVHLVIGGATIDSVVQRFDLANPSKPNLNKATGTVDISVLGSVALQGDVTMLDLYLRTQSDSVNISIDTCIIVQNTNPTPLSQSNVRGGVIIRK